jgi:asparagine synthase (glutamine-hydrolysing)
MFAWDTGAYLPDDLLVKMDVASMAHALENRSPFLDHRLFEHVGLLAPARRVSPRLAKPLLRRHAVGRVADEVLEAPKQGFQLPLDRWLRGPLEGWLESLVGDPQATGRLFRASAPRADLAAFREQRCADIVPYRLWALAVLEWWARRFAVDVGP